MDDSHDSEARMPRDHRHVSEQDLLESLNRCLWEVERRRAEEAVEPQ